MNRILMLPTGVKRLLLVFSFIVTSLPVALIIDDMGHSWNTADKVALVIGTIGSYLLFWVLVRIVLWILDGFKRDEDKKIN